MTKKLTICLRQLSKTTTSHYLHSLILYFLIFVFLLSIYNNLHTTYVGIGLVSFFPSLDSKFHENRKFDRFLCVYNLPGTYRYFINIWVNKLQIGCLWNFVVNWIKLTIFVKKISKIFAVTMVIFQLWLSFILFLGS